MATIVMTTKGSYGDLVPFIALGVALKHRGNSVTLISHCHYKEMATIAGLEFDSWDTPAQYSAFINDGALLDRPAGVRVFAERHIFTQFEAEYRVTARHCNQSDTVLVARHMASLAAECIAEQKSIPLVIAFTAVAQVGCLPLLRELYREVLGVSVNVCRKTVGLAPVTDWGAWLRGPRAFVGFWPSWFAPSAPDWPRELTCVGFLLSDGTESGDLPPGLRQLLEEPKRAILITGGTAVWSNMAAFYQKSMEACYNAGVTGILVCRHENMVPRELLPGIVPFKRLPFASLMHRIAAVIHHGGTSILVRALSAGIPQLALPFGGDRPDTASRLQELGVCITLPFGQWNTQTVTRALHHLLESESIAEACARYRLSTNNRDMLQGGCRLIESLGGSATNA
jgi:rhamnosyltransferase subunit B